MKKIIKSFSLDNETIRKMKKLSLDSGHTQSDIIKILVMKAKKDDLKPFPNRKEIKRKIASKRSKAMKAKPEKAFLEKRAKRSADDFSKSIESGELYKELKSKKVEKTT